MFQGFKPRQDMTGYTCLPNEWFDEVLAAIDNLAEMKIVQAVFRKTYGWVVGFSEGKPVYKKEDDISYTQFLKLTGLSTASVSEGIKRAMLHGYIIRVNAGSFGGSIKMETARYKIRTNEDTLPTTPPSNETPVPTPVEPLENTVEKVIITVEPSNPPQKTREEFKFAVSGKGSKVWDIYKAKAPADYNCNDLCYFFSEQYHAETNVPYSKITNKERKLMHELLEVYKPVELVTAIEHFVGSFKLYIDSAPSISALYGFRTSIMVNALNPSATKKVSVSQTTISDKDIGEGRKKGEVNQW